MTVLPFSRFRAPRLLRDPHDKTAKTLTHADTNALPTTLRLAPPFFYTTIARSARAASRGWRLLTRTRSRNECVHRHWRRARVTFGRRPRIAPQEKETAGLHPRKRNCRR